MEPFLFIVLFLLVVSLLMITIYKDWLKYNSYYQNKADLFSFFEYKYSLKNANIFNNKLKDEIDMICSDRIKFISWLQIIFLLLFVLICICRQVIVE